MTTLLNDICLWLSHQKGSIPQSYAKDLAKYITQQKEIKPTKYSDEWWKEVEEFNKQLKEQEK
jgi:hypothetical protein